MRKSGNLGIWGIGQNDEMRAGTAFTGLVAVFAIIMLVTYVLYHDRASLAGAASLSRTQTVRQGDHQPLPCNQSLWCDIALPKHSLFRFPPPTNHTLWHISRVKAMLGEPVLQAKVLEVLRDPMDFLNGDINFREQHSMMDYFLDSKHDFSLLGAAPAVSKPYQGDLPPPYLPTSRAVLIGADYSILTERKGQHSSPYFYGYKENSVYSELNDILTKWHRARDSISKPFILFSSFNENWGLLSTYFPNRTADWMRCCSARQLRALEEMLDDPRTYLMLINQHSNFTHPKLITLPRGLPINADNQRKLLWDTMRSNLQHRKTSMVYSASSAWGHRPALRKCILDRIGAADVQMDLYSGHRKGRVPEVEYYRRLASARMTVTMPGLGYDTFRIWEAMTLGVVPVLERGVGLDKTLWKLPALLVDDFSELTPQLLRTAYIEAIYRALAGDLDLRRLTQSFWWAFIHKVAASPTAQHSLRTVLEYFPLEAEDAGFARPAVPFACASIGTCGSGTKRTPRTYC